MMKVRIAAALTVAAPLLTFVAAVLTRNGVVPLDLGLDVLTMQVAWGLSGVAVGFAVLTLVLSLPQFQRFGLVSVASLLISAAVAATFYVQGRAIAEPGPLDVSTDLAEPPAVPGATTPVACPAAVAVMTQVAPEQATKALQGAGFSITESQLFRSRGVRGGFWFGMEHEAVIRIRPGRTDVRVVARYDHTDGGETCELAGRIVAGLQAGR